MCPQIINSIGLVSGIIGVIMIFIWGPPLSDFYGGGGIMAEDANIDEKTGKTYGELRKVAEIRRASHILISRFGLALICIGFGFQLWGCWM